MTGQLADDAIALGFAMVLDSTADITHMMACNSLLDALIERLLRLPEE
jgi:hypothetical protein